MNIIRSAVVCGPLLVTLSPMPALAAPAVAADCRSVAINPLQQRLLAKSDQGVEALRQFVFRTRGIYQLDMVEVAAWVTARRAAVRQCLEVAAATQAARETGG